MLVRALAPFNATCQQLGLAPLAHLVEQHASAAALLLATSRDFDFTPTSMPRSVRYVGPQLGDPKVGCWRAATEPRSTRLIARASPKLWC